MMFEYEQPIVVEDASWCMIEDAVENVADVTVTEELLEGEALQKLHAVESEVETISCETPVCITENAVGILAGGKLHEVEAGKDEPRTHSTSFTTEYVITPHNVCVILQCFSMVNLVSFHQQHVCVKSQVISVYMSKIQY